jgi:DNA-binding LacI/PurR family transcriptional regulator
LALEQRIVTLIDKKVEGIPFPSVVSNHEQGSFLATQYLIQRGHRRIAFVSPQGMDENTNIRDRYFGFCRAMYDAGLTVDDELNCVTASSASLTVESGELDTILDRLLDRGEPITAVHAVNDYLAVDLLKHALSRNISVPQQLSIVGFDNLEVTAHTEVPLTTIRQDFYGIGYAAARQASEGVRAKSTSSANGVGRDTPDTVVLPVSLIERDSVATQQQKA